MSHFDNNVLDYRPRAKKLLKLVLDENTDIALGDKPIFGAEVTICEDISSMVGRTVFPGTVLGWVDYVAINKFGCINSHNHYIDASEFLHTHQNQVVISKAIKVINFDNNLKRTHHILTFTPAEYYPKV